MTLSGLNLNWPELLGIVFVCLSFIFGLTMSLKFRAAKTLTIQRRSRLLSGSESKFFDTLKDALDDEYLVLSKIRIMDVVEMMPATTWLERAYIRRDLKGHCFDFVLCRRDNMSILGVIELKESSRHRNSRAQKRRANMLSRICGSANLKLFHMDSRRTYKPDDINRQIRAVGWSSGRGRVVRSSPKQAPRNKPQRSLSIIGHSRTCPKCHSGVITKIAVKGRSIGEKFLMCRKYPYCDYRVSKKELDNTKKLEQKKEPESKLGGYNNWSTG